MPNTIWPELDPGRLNAAWAAFAGALVYGVYTLATLLLSGRPVAARDLARAGVNVLAAILCGVAMGYLLTPVVTAAIPLASLRDASAVGFAIGAVGWEVLPFLLALVKNRARREADRQGGA